MHFCSHSYNKSRITKARKRVCYTREYCSVSLFLCSRSVAINSFLIQPSEIQNKEKNVASLWYFLHESLFITQFRTAWNVSISICVIVCSGMWVILRNRIMACSTAGRCTGQMRFNSNSSDIKKVLYHVLRAESFQLVMDVMFL